MAGRPLRHTLQRCQSQQKRDSASSCPYCIPPAAFIRCYMPGLRSVTTINGTEKTDWHMMVMRYGMLGPIFNTKAKAELEWGYVE